MPQQPLGGLAVEELIELRLDLIYAAQKAERAFTALISQKHREKNSRDYTADQLKAGNEDIAFADFALRASAKKILPALEALLAAETVPT